MSRPRARTWFEGQLDLDPLKLVFIDETAISTNMARRFGWAPRANAAGPRFRSDIGKPRRLSPRCAGSASTRR